MTRNTVFIQRQDLSVKITMLAVTEYVQFGPWEEVELKVSPQLGPACTKEEEKETGAMTSHLKVKLAEFRNHQASNTEPQ